MEDSYVDPTFSNFPRKSENAIAMSDDSPVAVVITESVSPYRVTYVNQAWVNLCGYSRDDVIGCTLGCIQGRDTNTSKLQQLTSNLIKGIDCSVRLTNYKKSGEAFENNLCVVPLKNKNNQITNFYGTLEECYWPNFKLQPHQFILFIIYAMMVTEHPLYSPFPSSEDTKSS